MKAINCKKKTTIKNVQFSYSNNSKRTTTIYIEVQKTQFYFQAIILTEHPNSFTILDKKKEPAILATLTYKNLRKRNNTK